ncbi:MAG: glycosyltransferase family 25 protein [Chlorobiaceae bacterium]
MNLVEYFDKTVIINLPERSDRRAETKHEFDCINWPIGKDNIDFFSAIRPENNAGFPSIGARGCFLSHLKAIKTATNEKVNNILILEDDISFISDINRVGTEVINLLKHIDWGFLYLGHEYKSLQPSNQILERISESLPLTHFYAINGNVFERFITFLEQLQKRMPGDQLGGPMHYDAAISTFRLQNPDINTFAVIPSLGYQRSSRTDLHELSVWDKWPLLSSITGGLRSIKNRIRKLSR